MSNPLSFSNLTETRSDQTIYADFLIKKEQVDAGKLDFLRVDNQEGGPAASFRTILSRAIANTTFEQQQAILQNNPGVVFPPTPPVSVNMFIAGDRFTIQWSAVPLAISYSVVVYESITSSGGFVVRESSSVTIPNTQYNTTITGSSGYYYYATVAAVGRGGESFPTQSPTIRFTGPPAPAQNIVLQQTGSNLTSTWTDPGSFSEGFICEIYKAIINPDQSINSTIITAGNLIQSASNLTSPTFTTSVPIVGDRDYYFARIGSYNILSPTFSLQSTATQYFQIPFIPSVVSIGDYTQLNSIFTSFTSSIYASSYTVTIYEKPTNTFTPPFPTPFETITFRNPETSPITTLTTRQASLRDTFFYFATAQGFNVRTTGNLVSSLTGFQYRRFAPSSVTNAQLTAFSVSLPPSRINSFWQLPAGITSSFTTSFSIRYYSTIGGTTTVPADPTTGILIQSNAISTSGLTDYTNNTAAYFFSDRSWFYALIQTFNGITPGAFASTLTRQYFAVPSTPSISLTQPGTSLTAGFSQTLYATQFRVVFNTTPNGTDYNAGNPIASNIVPVTGLANYTTNLTSPAPVDGTFYFATLTAINNTSEGFTVRSPIIQYSAVPGAPNVYLNFTPQFYVAFVEISGADTYSTILYSNATGLSNAGIPIFTSTMFQNTPGGGYSNTIYIPFSPVNGSYYYYSVFPFNRGIPGNPGITAPQIFYERVSFPSTPTIQLLSTVGNDKYLQINWGAPLDATSQFVTDYRVILYNNQLVSSPLTINNIKQQSTIRGNSIFTMNSSNNFLENRHWYWATVTGLNNTQLGAIASTTVLQYLAPTGTPIYATPTFDYVNTRITFSWSGAGEAEPTGVSTTVLYSNSGGSDQGVLQRFATPYNPNSVTTSNGTVFLDKYYYYATGNFYNLEVPSPSGTSAKVQYVAPVAPPHSVSTGLSGVYIQAFWTSSINGSAPYVTGYTIALWLSTPSSSNIIASNDIQGDYTNSNYTFDSVSLDNLSTYFVRVRAFNTTQDSGFTQTSAFSTSCNAVTYFQTPPPPTNVQVNISNVSSIFTVWTAPVPWITSYTVDIYTNGSTSNSTITGSTTLLETLSNITATQVFSSTPSLVNSNFYFSRVIAFNFAVSSFSTVSQQSVRYFAPPGAVSNASVSVNTQGTTIASWTNNADGFTNSNTVVFYRNPPGTPANQLSSVIQGTTVTIQTAQNATSPYTMNVAADVDLAWYFAQITPFNNGVQGTSIITPSAAQYTKPAGQPIVSLSQNLNEVSSFTASWYVTEGNISAWSTFFYQTSNPNTILLQLNLPVGTSTISTSVNLVDNTQYTMRVVGYNVTTSTPIGSNGVPQYFFYSPTAPSFVSTFLDAPTGSNINVNWYPPGDFTSTFVSQYRIRLFSTSATTPVGDVQVGSPYDLLVAKGGDYSLQTRQLDFSLYPLQNLAAYYTTVQAVNCNVYGGVSTSVNTTTFYGTPSSPIDLAVSLVGFSTLSTTWSPPSIGHPATNYIVNFWYSAGNNSTVTTATNFSTIYTNQTNISMNISTNLVYYFATAQAINTSRSSISTISRNNAVFYFPPSPPSSVLLSQSNSSLIAYYSSPSDFTSSFITSFIARFYDLGPTQIPIPTSNRSTETTAITGITNYSSINASTFFTDKNFYTATVESINNTVSSSRTLAYSNFQYLGIPKEPSSATILQHNANNSTFYVNFSSATDFTSSFPSHYVVSFYNNGYLNTTFASGTPLFFESTLTPYTGLTTTTYTYLTQSTPTDKNYYFATVQAINSTAQGAVSSVLSTLTSNLVPYFAPVDPPSSVSIFQEYSSLITTYSSPAGIVSSYITSFVSYLIDNGTNSNIPPAAGGGMARSTLASQTARNYSTYFHSTFFTDKNFYINYTQSINCNVSSAQVNTAYQLVQYLGLPAAPSSASIALYNSGTNPATSSFVVQFSTAYDFTSSFPTSYRVQWYTNGFLKTTFATGTPIPFESTIIPRVNGENQLTSLTYITQSTPVDKHFYFAALTSLNSNASYAVSSVISTLTSNLIPFFATPGAPSSVSMRQEYSTLTITFSSPTDGTSTFITSYTTRLYDIGNASGATPSPFPITGFTSSVVLNVSTPNFSTSFFSTSATNQFRDKQFYFAYVESVNCNVSSGLTAAFIGQQYLGIPTAPSSASISLFDPMNNPATSTFFVQFSTALDYTSSFPTSYRVEWYTNGFLNTSFATGNPQRVESTILTRADGINQTTSNTYITQSTPVDKHYYFAVLTSLNSNATSLVSSPISTLTTNLVPFFATPGAPSSVSMRQEYSTLTITFSSPTDGTSTFITSYTTRLYDIGNASGATPSPFPVTGFTSSVVLNVSTINFSTSFFSTAIANQFRDKQFYFAYVESVNCNVSSGLTAAFIGQQYLGIPTAPSSASISLFDPMNNPATSTFFVQFSTALDYTSSFPTSYRIEWYTNGFLKTSFATGTPVPFESTILTRAVGINQTTSNTYITQSTPVDKHYYFAVLTSLNSNATSLVSSPISTLTTNLVPFFATPGAPSSVSMRQENSTLTIFFSSPTDGTSTFITSYTSRLYDIGNASGATPSPFPVTGFTSSVLLNVSTPNFSTSFFSTSATNQFRDKQFYFAYVQSYNCNVSSGLTAAFIGQQYLGIPAAPSSASIFLDGPLLSTFNVQFSTALDYTSSFPTHYIVQWFDNGELNFNYTGGTPVPFESTSITRNGSPNQTTSNSYTTRSTPVDKHCYFAMITSVNSTNQGVVSSVLSTGTANIIPFYVTPGVPSSISIFQQFSTIQVSISSPQDGTSSFITSYITRLYDVGAVNSYPPAIPGTGALSTQITNTFAPSFLTSFFSTPTQFKDQQYYLAYTQSVNCNISSAFVGAYSLLKYEAIPGNPIQVSTTFTNSSINITWSTPTDYTSSIGNTFMVYVYDNGTSATFAPGATVVQSSFVSLVPSATSRGYTSYSITDLNAPLVDKRFYYGTVQTVNGTVSSLSSVSVNLVPFYETVSPPIFVSTGFNGFNLFTFFSTPVDRTSSIVTRYDVSFFNNGASGVINTATATLFSTIPVFVTDTTRRVYSTILNATPANASNYYTVVRAYNSVLNQFSSIAISSQNTAVYYIPPNAPYNVTYSIQGGGLTAQWLPPSDSTSSFITSYTASLYSTVNTTIPSDYFTTFTPIAITTGIPPTTLLTTFFQQQNGGFYFIAIQAVNNTSFSLPSTGSNSPQFIAQAWQSLGANGQRTYRAAYNGPSVSNVAPTITWSNNPTDVSGSLNPQTISRDGLRIYSPVQQTNTFPGILTLNATNGTRNSLTNTTCNVASYPSGNPPVVTVTNDGYLFMTTADSGQGNRQTHVFLDNGTSITPTFRFGGYDTLGTSIISLDGYYIGTIGSLGTDINNYLIAYINPRSNLSTIFRISTSGFTTQFIIDSQRRLFATDRSNIYRFNITGDPGISSGSNMAMISSVISSPIFLNSRLGVQASNFATTFLNRTYTFDMQTNNTITSPILCENINLAIYQHTFNNTTQNKTNYAMIGIDTNTLSTKWAYFAMSTCWFSTYVPGPNNWIAAEVFNSSFSTAPKKMAYLAETRSLFFNNPANISVSDTYSWNGEPFIFYMPFTTSGMPSLAGNPRFRNLPISSFHSYLYLSNDANTHFLQNIFNIAIGQNGNIYHAHTNASQATVAFTCQNSNGGIIWQSTLRPSGSIYGSAFNSVNHEIQIGTSNNLVMNGANSAWRSWSMR